jgi:hypothetical protein
VSGVNEASRKPWNHNIHHYDLVLRSVPRPCRRALDVDAAGACLHTVSRIAVMTWLRSIRGQTDVAAPIQEPRETLGEIREACQDILPGAVLRRHLLFRYSVVWRRN